ncbi:MAG: right-handed parallel beta-helix repeat-containing protein [Candidatus Bathyarchaeum sp.]|nr:MAG: right-handed parallel beta-helix repeat-containing protein [Candidatus Bathyarchaeum sp.]
MGKRRTTLVVLLVLSSFIVSTREIEFAAANYVYVTTSIPKPAFIIRNDGSVHSTDNFTVPIRQVGNFYILTDDVVGYTIAVDCDNIVIDGGGYTIQGYGNSTGIFIKNRNGVTVRNMQISNFSYGIRLFSEYIDGFTGNHIVSGNDLTNNLYGIYMSSQSNNVLRNNRMNNNKHSFHVTVYSFFEMYSFDIDPAIFYHDIDTSNTENGKPIYYFVNEQNMFVPNDAAYICLINCTKMLVQNFELSKKIRGITLVSTTYSNITHNKITNNIREGIYLFKSAHNLISENDISDNGDGICVYKSSSNNSIFGNNILYNEGYGIQISGSSKNIISGNNIAENANWGIELKGNTNSILKNYIAKNGKGIFCYGSSHNRIIGNKVVENNGWCIRLEENQKNNSIYHNYFIDNKVEEGLQVYMLGFQKELLVWVHANPCVWDDGERGNYWSNYTTRYPNATKNPETGIGDTPFYININNIDHYPVMEISAIPEFPSWIFLPLFLMATFVVVIVKKRLRHPH